MLDVGHDPRLSAFPWDELRDKPNLPVHMRGYFEQKGALPVHPECRRAYHRFYLRSKAILRRPDVLLGVYTTDASRKGIRFLSPVQLFPKQRGRIQFPNAKELCIEVVRCRRVEKCCYECGAIFVLGT